MSDNPIISVIMPVYNAGEFVREAIQSILDQTFTDFEFIIIDDGSTDNSLQIIESFKDHRIIILTNTSNTGNYPSRNKGLKIARGKYICVMDADDVASPIRLERQYYFMENYRGIGLAGSGFRYLGNNTDVFRENDFDRIKVILLRNDCFIHPTLILRQRFLNEYNLEYNEKYFFAADYDLIVRAARFFKVTNMPEILLNYRIHKDQITTKNRQKQMEYADEIALDQLKYLGITPDESETRLHLDFLKGNMITYSDKHSLVDWIERIKRANQESDKNYNEYELESFFNTLLSEQKYIKESIKFYHTANPEKVISRIDLMDVTFLIHIKSYSEKNRDNLASVINFITRHFSTRIIIVESGREQPCPVEEDHDLLYYLNLSRENEVFTVHDFGNLLLMADTPFIAIWDGNVIVPPDQVLEAVNKLREGEDVLVCPYDGRYCYCNELVSNLFNETGNMGSLNDSVSEVILRNDYHSVRGAFIVKKNKYLVISDSIDNISDSELRDAARIIMFELSGLPLSFTKGCLFQLWYPTGKNQRSSDSVSKINDLKKFLTICSITA